MSGWIKLHRDIFDSDIWHDVTTFRLFIYLIGKASHQDGLKYKGMILNKGQYVRSYRKLADDLSYKEGRGYKKYSLSTIKSCVNKLIDAERVNVRETELGTLFTVVNYALYQDNQEHLIETPNTFNEEVRTKSERSPNEVRTKSEQDQELKNLRIKEDTTTTSNPVQLFEKLLCRLSPNQMNALYQWQDDFEGQAEIVNEAIQIADDKNKRYFGFVEYLLKEWANNKLDSLDRVRAYEQEKFNKYKKPAPGNRKVIRTELLPDWFDEDQETQPKQQLTLEDMQAKRKMIEEKLKKFKT